MNSFFNKINNKVLLVLVVIVLAGYSIFQQYSHSIPEKNGEQFLKTLTTKEVSSFLSKEDEVVFEKHSKDFLKYLPLSLVQIPPTSIKFKETINTSADNKKQVFFEVDGRKIQLTMVDEGSWKVYLNLDFHQKKYEAERKLEEVQKTGSQEDILEAYNALNLIDPQEFYASQIKAIAQQINERTALIEYVEKVKISKVKISKGIISAFIQNTGNKNLTKVEAEILITDKDGKILYKEIQIIFEQIPGSKLYGSSIPAGFEKKVNFDISSLNQKKDVLVLISPVTISYE